MKSLGSVGSFLRALLLVLLAFICTGNSFKQELWLYDEQDNAIQFHSQVADMSDFTSFLPKVTRACATGYWDLFSATNFRNYFTLHGGVNSGIVCRNFTTASSVKSLRHWGANDTDTDAISLYDEYNWSGKEVLVTARALTGITNQIKTFAATGTSNWTLFEGMELDGNSTCFKVPKYAGCYFNWGYAQWFGLTRIRSVFKGCDAQEIQNYKMLHKSNFINSN